MYRGMYRGIRGILWARGAAVAATRVCESGGGSGRRKKKKKKKKKLHAEHAAHKKKSRDCVAAGDSGRPKPAMSLSSLI